MKTKYELTENDAFLLIRLANSIKTCHTAGHDEYILPTQGIRAAAIIDLAERIEQAKP